MKMTLSTKSPTIMIDYEFLLEEFVMISFCLIDLACRSEKNTSRDSVGGRSLCDL